MNPDSLRSEIGIGATDELSLRVSVATLVRVIIAHPNNNETLLALERRCTVWHNEPGQVVEIKSQPFGGAIQFWDAGSLQQRIGPFHFDSEESRVKRDFRIFIRPDTWDTVLEFCLEHLRQPSHPVLETDPVRELTEELADTCGAMLQPDQYTLRAVGTIVEDHPSATENFQARGYLTARIYRIFEAKIVDRALAETLKMNSDSCSDLKLRELAENDTRNGGPRWANAVLTLPLQEIHAYYLTLPSQALNQPILFHNHRLDETVAAVLDDVTVSKYRRL